MVFVELKLMIVVAVGWFSSGEADDDHSSGVAQWHGWLRGQHGACAFDEVVASPRALSPPSSCIMIG